MPGMVAWDGHNRHDLRLRAGKGKERAIVPPVRLFGTDKEEIFDPAGWLQHAPPEKGKAQWKDGYSAKEQAKAWLRPGSPAVPEEVWSVLGEFVDGEAEAIHGRPEHQTKLDNYGRRRQHDMLACVRRAGQMVLVGGIEAKACEDFGGLVKDRAAAAPPSNKRARCNLMARALFGRDVFDEQTGEVLDKGLASHGYQLWTATVGTIIEAQARGLDEAVVNVHQFKPADAGAAGHASDRRDWQRALDTNSKAFESFKADLQGAGAKSHKTDFVAAGTVVHLCKVESIIAT